MKALITGANGFIGSHLARSLVERGSTVRCLVRRTSDRTLLDGIGVELAEGDVTEPASLSAAVKGVDVIFHLAGTRRSPSPADFDRVNVTGTRMMLEAAASTTTPARFVLASSLAAIGPSAERHPHEEDDPPRPTEWYGESKAKAEEVCREFSTRVPVTILRPPRVVGPGDRENLFFFKMVKKGFRLVLGGGARHLSMIDVDDLIDAFIRLGEHPSAVNQAFFAATDEMITLTELLDWVAEGLGVHPRTAYVPQSALTAVAYLADGFSKLTGKHLPLNRKLARQLLATGWTCSNAKAKRVLGFTPKIGLRESIIRSARWYVEAGWL